eukprot:1143144-Pelagomonas_calceolata.AAC.4
MPFCSLCLCKMLFRSLCPCKASSFLPLTLPAPSWCLHAHAFAGQPPLVYTGPQGGSEEEEEEIGSKGISINAEGHIVLDETSMNLKKIREDQVVDSGIGKKEDPYVLVRRERAQERRKVLVPIEREGKGRGGEERGGTSNTHRKG